MKSFPAGNEISDQRQENQEQRGNIHLCDAHGTSHVSTSPAYFLIAAFSPGAKTRPRSHFSAGNEKKMVFVTTERRGELESSTSSPHWRALFFNLKLLGCFKDAQTGYFSCIVMHIVMCIICETGRDGYLDGW